jgi:hypothetical protein
METENTKTFNIKNHTQHELYTGNGLLQYNAYIVD